MPAMQIVLNEKTACNEFSAPAVTFFGVTMFMTLS
ncbi:MAG: hypothetical protein JWM30_413 [Burkholderia sp.]|nr:hypothetical protein [Burkholderia sp.]